MRYLRALHRIPMPLAILPLRERFNIRLQNLHCKASSLRWCHNEHDDVSNHQRLDCLPNRLFGRRSKKTSKFRVTGLCEGNSPVTGEFPAQSTSDAENVFIWWRHHVTSPQPCTNVKPFTLSNNDLTTLDSLHPGSAPFWYIASLV